jgi:hypothetical protein
MYITADGEAELVREGMQLGYKYVGDQPPISSGSTDVDKAETIYSETPDGNMRLLDFFNKIERKIAKEVEGRKNDIEALRAHMEKNRQYNAAARHKMKTNIKAKMAKNAKIAKDALNKAMRETQEKFAKNARAENKRHKADIKAFKAMRALMRKNKKEAADNLRTATEAQNRALSALSSATNAHISQTNKHIAANAAAIANNAKEAQRQLQHQMDAFNKKMAKVQANAKAGRSKLMAQAATQDKKFRTWANNKVQQVANQAAAKFAKVRKTMAKDRHAADSKLEAMSTKMTATMSAQAALQDKRFADTVDDIEAAKKKAADDMAKAEAGFKVQMLELASTAKKQVYELNQAQNKLAGTVEHNRMAQANTQKNVDAELLRMTKLGNDRYAEHLAKDKELNDLVKHNREDNKQKMVDMAKDFNSKMNDIRDQMAKDRAASANNLKKATDALYSTLSQNKLAQDAANKNMEAATQAMGKDAADALEDAKVDFAKRLGNLHETAIKSAKRQSKKVAELTGVVEADAIKNQEGRDQLAAMQNANKQEIEHAITNAINLGEQRATKLEAHMKEVNDNTKAELHGSIETQIASLRDDVKKSLFQLSLDSKESRKILRKQVLASLTEASAQTAKDLKAAVTWATGRFAALDAMHETNAEQSAAERAALEQTIADERALAEEKISNAMDAQAKAQFAFATETADSLSETNENLADEAEKMKNNAAAVKAKLVENTGVLNSKLAAAKKAAEDGQMAADAAAQARYAAAIKAVADGIAKAKTKAEARFGAVYEDMAKNVEHAKAELAAATEDANDAMAQEAMLQNKQFTKMLKKGKRLAKYARIKVAKAKKKMKMKIAKLTGEIKKSETRVQGEIAVVTGDLISNQAAQARTNKKVKAALENIVATSNRGQTASNRFHKELRSKANAMKKLAAEETKALADKATTEVALIRGKMAEDRRAAATALTDVTQELSKGLAKQANDAADAMQGLTSQLASAKADTASSLKTLKEKFGTKVNSITNLITSLNHQQEKRLEQVTGYHMDLKNAAEEDRELMRDEIDVLNNDLNKALGRAVQLGEARFNKLQKSALRDTDSMRRAMLSTIAEQVEDMADTVFATVQGNRQQIADNYLSLKAYAVAAKGTVADYVAKGKGRNLACLGDMLQTIGDLEHIEVGKSDGVGAGSGEIAQVFSGKKIKVKNPVNKINFMVNEYISTMSQLHSRWPLGLGRYLLDRVEIHMQQKGVLEVDHIDGKNGNYVFINGHSVGLSSRLSDFEKLAVRMTKYQAALKHLSSKTVMKAKPQNAMVKPVVVPPPEWQGD